MPAKLTQEEYMATTAKEMVAKAKEVVPSISPEDARTIIGNPDVLLG